MGLHKILKYVAMAFGLIGVVLLGMIWLKGDDEVIANFQGGIDGYFYVAYIILAIVLVLVLIYVIKGLAAGDIKKTLISIGAFILVIVISYALSTGTETVLKDGDILTEGQSRLVGTGLRAFYILTLVAIGSMFFSGIKKLIAK